MKLATLCYLRSQGKTLMILRNKMAEDRHLNKWNGLGGKFLLGETPEECARREIREESGLEVSWLDLKGFLTFPEFDGPRAAGGQDWYVFVFNAYEPLGELSECSEGELHWIDDTKIMDLNLWEGDRIFIPMLDEEGIFSAKFEYVNKSLVRHSICRYSTCRYSTK